LELDPLSPGIHSALCWAYFNDRKYDLAMSSALQALELDRNFFHGHYWLGWTLFEMEKPAEALAEFQGLLRNDPDSVMARMALGFVFAVTGRQADAKKVIEDLDRLSSRRYVTSYPYALTYLGLGDIKTALDWLEKAYNARDPLMPFLKADLGQSPLRDEPRFQALMKRVENGGRDN
jgi:serine/threonine-protein kinase